MTSHSLSSTRTHEALHLLQQVAVKEANNLSLIGSTAPSLVHVGQSDATTFNVQRSGCHVRAQASERKRILRHLQVPLPLLLTPRRDDKSQRSEFLCLRLAWKVPLSPAPIGNSRGQLLLCYATLAPSNAHLSCTYAPVVDDWTPNECWI